jgi:predicted permease
VVGRSARQVGLFAAAVSLVLLLAIVNVATLVLLRASARGQELAVRVMLGARRGRVARLLVTENLILTLLAAGVGLLIAVGGIELAVAQLANVPRIQNVSLDWRVILLSVSAAIVSGIIVSLSPIATLRARSNLASQATGRRTDSGHRTNRVRAAFVSAQFALAWPLLVASGLLLNSFLRLQQVDPGFNPDGLISVGVNLPRARYPGPSDLVRFQTLARQRIAELPQVSSAAVASNVPPDPNYGGFDNFNLVHRPVPTGQAEPTVPWYNVGTNYFSTLGIRLVEGRNFIEADSDSGAPPVVVVSESFARQFMPGESAVGRLLVQGGCYDCPRTTIVGVVEDVRNLGPSLPMVAAYNPLGPSNLFEVLVRSRSSATATRAAVRDALRALDPELPVVETVISERVAASISDPRRWATVLTAFAASGLGLAALGVFGLMAYSVRQRRRELGVRLALGAEPSSVTRLVVTRGMRYAGIGSIIGFALTLIFVKRIQPMLFGVGPNDALTIAAVGALLLGSALLASWIPGRRAARIRPMEAISVD